MPLNADQLDAFWTIVQTGSFHKAADQLFITQSAVTQRIQSLENALGTRLFVRAGRGVALTAAGEQLARHCRSQREAEQQLRRRLIGEEERWAGRLAIASGSEEGRTWLLPALAELGRAHPELDLELIIADDLDPIALLTTCRVEAVIGDRLLRRRGVRSSRLGALPQALVASPAVCEGWPARPEAATLLAGRAVDFHAQDRITLDFLAEALPEADFSGLRRHFVDDAYGILQWVLAGGGFSVLPLALVQPHLETGALVRFFPDVRRERVLYWSAPEGAPSPAVAWLFERLVALF